MMLGNDEHGLNVKGVRVKRDELLEKVRANRADHKNTFEKALKVYREDVIAELERSILDAREGRRIRRSIELVEPINQTKEYDKIIAMLQMSVDDEVVLTSEDFAQYVMDDWRWKDAFIGSTAGYINKSR